MPLYKKMLVAEIPHARYAFANKDSPKLVDMELADPALFSMSAEEFMQHFQGFWVQKQNHGCIQPSSTYQINMTCVQRQLYIFAEQKVGSDSNEAQHGATKTGQTSSFKAF